MISTWLVIKSIDKSIHRADPTSLHCDAAADNGELMILWILQTDFDVLFQPWGRHGLSQESEVKSEYDKFSLDLTGQFGQEWNLNKNT